MKEKSFSAICPFSGKILKTSISIFYKGYIFYQFTNTNPDKTFWIIPGLLGKGFPKAGILFRSGGQHIFLYRYGFYSSKRITRENIIGFLALQQTGWKGPLMQNYFQTPEKKLALYVCSRQFFHYIWNQLSGLHQISEQNCMKEVDTIFVGKGLSDYTCLRPEQLFPHIQKKVQYVSPQDLLPIIKKQNYFLLRFGSIKMSQNFLDSAYESCLKDTDPTFLQTMLQFRARHALIMVISIRSGMSKNWSNQIDGMSQIMNALNERYPQIGFIIDGFSVVKHPVSQRVIDEQNTTVQQILSKVRRKDNVWSTVGCQMNETVVLSRMIDLYFTVHGSQQHKWGWFGNKPGLVHGPVSRMERMEQAAIEFQPMYSIENPMICLNIPSHHIKDSGAGLQDLYEYDWKLALDRLDSIIKTLQTQDQKSRLEIKKRMTQID